MIVTLFTSAVLCSALPQDGPRLSIQFNSQSEYELDADTQDEKNKVCMILSFSACSTRVQLVVVEFVWQNVPRLKQMPSLNHFNGTFSKAPRG